MGPVCYGGGRWQPAHVLTARPSWFAGIGLTPSPTWWQLRQLPTKVAPTCEAGWGGAPILGLTAPAGVVAATVGTVVAAEGGPPPPGLVGTGVAPGWQAITALPINTLSATRMRM